jgi:predicted ATPase
VKDSLPEKMELRDMGERRLKDILQAEPLYQVVVADLPSDFPPLKTLETFRHNLPTQLTSFVGREREMEEAGILLASTRLLTFIGPGGGGKTRLSFQVAAAQLPGFKDGVWVVELAPLADPAFIVSSIASVFGLGEMQGIPLIQTVLDYLRAKQLLLVLDNCEHLVAASAQIANQILQQCLHVKILASSREALGMDGETAYRVQPLPDDEARQLFIDRATRAEPRFHVTESNAAFIAQICSRLEGIPLAIELAAARVKMFTPEQITERLDDRFRLLTGGNRTALPHQQTLRALIDWSYEALDETEQRAFRRLAVFSGGWAFEAAEAVIGENEALEELAGLVNKSLVNVEEEQDESRYPTKDLLRYRFLETVRQYALEKLLESSEAAQIQERHLNYFLGFAQRAEQKMTGVEMPKWLNLLELEHDNIRNALQWSLDNKPQAALRLVNSVADLWLERGYLAEGKNWCQEALARTEKLPHEGGEMDRARSEAMSVLAWLSFGRDLHAGQNAAKESVALARQSGDTKSLTFALQTLGLLSILQGHHRAGQKAAKEGAALARQTGDTMRLGWTLRILGLASAFLGDTTLAFDSLHEAEAIARQMDYKHLLMRVLGSLVMVTKGVYGQKAQDQAQAYLEERIALAQELGDTRTLMDSEADLALLELARGQFDQARTHVDRVIAHDNEMGNQLALNQFRSDVAHTWRELGYFEEALAIYRETVLFWQKIDHQGAVAHQLECFGFIAKAEEEWERAVKLLSAAESLREVSDSPLMHQGRTEKDKEIAELRAGMDQEVFNSLWAEGQRMTMEQAVAFALEKTDA